MAWHLDRFERALATAAHDLEALGYHTYIDRFPGYPDSLFVSIKQPMTDEHFFTNGSYDWSIESVNVLVEARTGRFVLIDPS